MHKRILIVDDADRVAFFLKEGLLGLGSEYEVYTTESGELALDRIQSQPFDLAVIDYRLPGIDGLDLIRQIQHLSPTTLTILITAYGSPELEDEAYHLRAHRYFAKPFPLEDLMSTVQQALA